MENQLAKIAILESSEEALTKAFDVINLDFDGGRVTKTELASWFISQGARGLNEAVIQEIRQAHFNQVKYLDNLVKKLKSSGRESLGAEEIANLQTLLSQQPAKRKSRPAKQLELPAEKPEQA